MPWKTNDVMKLKTEFVLQAMQSGTNFSRLCHEYGISPKTGYKWKQRFLAEGMAGLQESSRRPLRSPNALSESVVCEIIRIKGAHRAWGAGKIREVYRRAHGQPPSETSFKRVFEKAGLTTPRSHRKARAAGRLASGVRAQAPNQVWTVDFKGWWHTADKRRCEPLTVRDEFSRYVLDVHAVRCADTQAVRERFERLFSINGLPEVIRSDNGPPFASRNAPLGLSRLSAWWVALGIDLERNRPGCPQDNPAHERLHRDIRFELQTARFADLQQAQASFDIWRETYNWQRPHQALHMRSPGQLYSKSTRPFDATPRDLEYPQGFGQRRIGTGGHLRINGENIFVSTALYGWSVGLKPLDASTFELWFGPLLLGHLDLSTISFRRADIGPAEADRSSSTT